VSPSSGNEYIQTAHPASGWLRWLALLLGVGLPLWINLTAVAQARWPLHGFGVLGAPFRFQLIITVFGILFRPGEMIAGVFGALLGAAAHVFNPSHTTAVSATHIWWLSWWQFASNHILGAGVTWFGYAPWTWELTLNTIFLVLIWGPIIWWAGQLSTTPDPSRRPGTSVWTGKGKLGLYEDAARRPDSLPLGTVVRGLPQEETDIAIPAQQRFEHIEVLGVTGSGKTGCIFKPWVLHDGLLNGPVTNEDGTYHPRRCENDADGRTWDYTGAYSTVAIDIKFPDLYDAVAPYLAAQPARRLLVLAPDHPYTTMGYNPLDALDPSDPDTYRTEIAGLVQTIVENTPKQFMDVPYHQNIETQLLQDLVQFAYEAEPVIDRAHAEEILRPFLERGQKLPRVRSLSFLSFLCRLPGSAFLDFVSEVQTDPQVPDKWTTRFQQHHERTKAELTGTLLGLQRRLAAFMSPGVTRVTQHSHFRLETVGERPTTLIIGTPMSSGEATQTFAALMITQLIDHLVRLAKTQPNRRLPVPVMIFLDEVINQARIPILEDYVATLREFGIGFVIGLQDYSGLRQRYGDDAARKLLSNLRTKVIFGQGLNPEQAKESVLPMLGDTTIVTLGTSSSADGERESMSVRPRPLMTVDQVREMPFGEVILGLHEGQRTKTRLALMPRRDPVSWKWRYDPIPSADTKTMCAPLVRVLDSLRIDRRLTEPFRKERKTEDKPPLDREVLLHRLTELGDLFRRTLTPALNGPTETVGTTNGTEWPTGSDSTPFSPNGQELAVDTGAPIINQIVDKATRHSKEGRAEAPVVTSAEKATSETPKPKGHAGMAPPPPSVAATVPLADKPADPVAPPAEPKAPPTPKPTPPPAPEVVDRPVVDPERVMDEVRGLYNALLVRRDLLPAEAPVPSAWRIQGDLHVALAVRREVLESYATRRSTKVDRMIAIWEAAGLAQAVPTQLSVGRETVRVYLLTQDAIRDDRIAPALRDKMSLWPDLAASALRIPGPNGAKKTSVKKETEKRVPVEKSDDPNVVLQGVIRWAQEHKTELMTPGADPIGQWETLINNVSTLLIRSNTAMRLLGLYTSNTRLVMQAWKDAGTLVISSTPSDQRENRFTVFARAQEGRLQAGTRYLAFAWQVLEQAGLHR